MSSTNVVGAGPRGGSEEVKRPRGRDLSIAELRAYVTRFSNQPHLWAHLVRHDAGQRHYEELECDEHLTLWLICWSHDHDTGFHDHDASAGAVAVTAGAVREERFALDGRHRERVYAAGEVFDFSPADIHRIRTADRGPAVTLHAYSPPLQRMGAYFVAADGVLARRPMLPEEELRPLMSGAAVNRSAAQARG